MKLLAPFIATAVFAAACASNQTVVLSSQFDPATVEPMLRAGGNQVSGSALIRQVGGGVVTCAGGMVYLMPVSPYAREWARVIYQSEVQGYYKTQGRGIEFSNLDQRFAAAVRSTACNAQGFFNFPDVADGQFYVFAKVNWRVGGEIQGGSLMKSVSVRGGQKSEIVLSTQ